MDFDLSGNSISDELIDIMLKEQQEAEKELISYKSTEVYTKNYNEMVDYLKTKKRFVWDGCQLPVWNLPVAYDDMDQFVCAIMHEVEGVEDDTAIFSTTIYDCGEIKVEEMSGQGTVHILTIKEVE